MRIKERPRRFLAIVLILLLGLGSIPEAMNYVTADAVIGDSEIGEKTEYSISVVDKAGIVTDSAIELKYRIVATGGALFPASTEDPLVANAEDGYFTLSLISEEVANVETIQGIQITDISYENYISASLKNIVFDLDSFATGSSIDVDNVGIAEGFLSKEVLTEEGLDILLSGRPEFDGALIAKDDSETEIWTEKWAKNVEITGGILRTEEEADYSAYSVYWYEEGNRTDTELNVDEDGKFAFSVPEEGEKTYCFYVKRENEDGSSYRSREQRISLKMDATSPEVTILTANMAEAEWASSISIEGTVVDSLSGIDKVYYTWDDGDGQYGLEDAENKIALDDTALTESDADGKRNYAFLVSAIDEVYKNRDLYVIAVDQAGNEDIEKITLNLDGVKPIIEDIKPEDISKWTKDAITVIVKVKDNGQNITEQSGIKCVYYRADGKATDSAIQVKDTEDTYSFTISEEKTFAGNYAIWCEDNAGNISDIKSISVHIDKDMCIISDAQANPSDWTKEKVKVTGTIRDEHSGVAVNEIKYCKEGAADTERKAVTIESGNDKDKEISYSFELEPDDYDGNYIIFGSDVVGNTTYAAVSVKMDKTKPEMVSVNLSSSEWLKEGETLIVTGSVLDVVENNAVSDIKRVCYGKRVQGNRIEIASKDTLELSETKDNTYEYSFEISSTSPVNEMYYIWCEDNAGNISDPMAFQVKIDTAAPSIEAEVSEEKWTNQNVVISGNIYDAMGGIAGSGVQEVYVAIEKDGNRTTDSAITFYGEGAFTYTASENTDAFYTIIAVDKMGHEGSSESFHIQIDKNKPRILGKKITPEGWTANDTVSVSVTTEDEPKDSSYSGVKKICWEREDGKSTGENQANASGQTVLSLSLAEGETAFNGNFRIWCVDTAGNESQSQNVTVMIDKQEGVFGAWMVEEPDWITGSAIVKGIAYDEHSGVKKVTYKAEDASAAAEKNKEGTAIATNEDNQYAFSLEPQDYEGNYIVQIEDNVGNLSTMEIGVKMDKTQPKVENHSSQKEGEWTKDSLEITGNISDNLSGVAGIYYSTEEKGGREQTASAGTIIKEEQNGGKAEFSFVLDNRTAAYDQIDTIYVWCEDIAGNLSEEVAVPIWLENTKPEITEVKKTEEGSSLVDTLLEIFTLGIYKAPTELKVIVNDNSRAGSRKSDIASVYWEYEVTGEKEGSGIIENQSATIYAADLKECKEEGYSGAGYWEGVLRLGGNYRGTFDFLVTDYAGNASKREIGTDGERSILIDAVAPVFEGYSYPAEQTRTSGVHYYSDTAVVSMRIRESNFQYNQEGGTEVSVLDNNVRGQNVSAWNRRQGGITWESSITLSGEGTHVITSGYTDPSGNAMVSAQGASMQSETIVVDRTAPVISVSYDQNNSNRYYNAIRRATISIREVNFDAGRVQIKMMRTNVLGEDIGEINYNGANLGWSHNGNIHTAQIDCPGDANYTLQIAASDLANNEAQEFQDSFTVDTSAPANLSVSYGSLNSFSRSVDGATFTNYYNNQIQVTISATDTTSGVEQFVYSYKKSDGVSGVNAELINAVISQAEIVQNGNEYRATFYIPREALGGMNQFNGTVDFTAYDRSGNSSTLQDNRRIIVDNISPAAEISYSTPVREENNIAYYDGSIEATLVINEANFDAGAVEVRLELDGNSTVVTPSWTDDSTDIHTGRFTISGDGDYRVTVNYTDSSDNQMAEYRSEQMTIDTEAPTISVSGIRANSATNSEENFAFSITAQDTNLDSSTFKPILMAVIPDEQGNYQTTEISLGEMTETPNGEKIASATYSVENLERDAFYTLTCTVSDMVNHANQNGVFTLTDKEGNNGGEMEQVQFSINREGSTFHVTEQTEKILSDYYVKNLKNAVVVEEINVDPIENYVVELNGEMLSEENGNFTSMSEGNGADGSWCRRTYSLNNALFENEGEYNIVVHSTDKADTIAYSDVKNVKVAFVVDETAPTVTISGLSENSNYQTTEQKVTVLPKDDGGKLNSFEALVDGESQLKLSGEELENYLEEHDGVVELSVSEGINREMEIICMDCAIDQSGNGEDYNIYRETFGNITVSPNSFVLFFANKPLFYGSIAGVVLLGAFFVFIVVYRKKRKKEL